MNIINNHKLRGHYKNKFMHKTCIYIIMDITENFKGYVVHTHL